MTADEMTHVEERVIHLAVGMAEAFLADFRGGHLGEGITSENATVAFRGYWKAWESNDPEAGAYSKGVQAAIA